MGKAAKTLLAIGAVIVLLAVAAIAGLVWWLDANKERLKAQGDAAKSEAATFAAGRSQRDCVAEGLRRVSACDGLMCRALAEIFVEACLGAAEPTSGLCDGVPKTGEIMASVKWRLAQCAQRAGDAKQCSNLMGAVQDYCEERTDRLPSYGKHAGTVDRLRAALAAEPCDRKAVQELAQTYNEAGDLRGTVALTGEFEKRCGEHLLLLWKTVYAHEQLGQWKEAAALDGRLLADAPRDADFWWWRGKARMRLEQLEPAAADLLQSIANSEIANSTGVAVMLFADAAEKLERPCEGARAVGLFVDAHGAENVTQTARDRHTALHLAGGCDEKKATGKAVIKRKRGAPLMKTAAVVQGTKGRFAVDPGTGLSVVTASFAERAGLKRREGPELDTVALASVVRGRPASADAVTIGKAEARDVEVLVVDSLPGKLDGVLGLSLLWRFDTRAGGNKLTLRGP